MFELKPDFEDVFQRYEAWWHCDITDRPLTCFTFPQPEEKRVPAPPQKNWDSLAERWLDTEYQVEKRVANLKNTVFYADALPVTIPNLGPEIFSAFYGCPLYFGEQTSWSEPVLFDWSEEAVNKLQLDQENFYLKKILELTDALIEAGKNTFIVGYTDLHPGGDCIAAFRDPQELCIDMLENPDAVKRLLPRITEDFLSVYDLFHKKLTDAGMPSTTWLNVTGKGKMHVPSNDFSCMISEEQFKEIFVPWIIEECRHMDRCIYHLDGPNALRFLDILLEIPEIQAIQWVPGAGRSDWKEWTDVYQRIQKAGKAIETVGIPVQELEEFFEILNPEGVRLNVAGVNDEATAQEVMKTVSRWRQSKKT